MDFAAIENLASRKEADLIAIPYFKNNQGPQLAGEVKNREFSGIQAIELGDFKGKEGEVLIVYSPKGKEKRIALLGLGEKEKLTVEILRRAYSALIKAANQQKLKEINLLLPDTTILTEDLLVRGVVEGVLLANYKFDKHKHDAIKDCPTSLVSKITLLGAHKSAMKIANKYSIICKGVYFARDLTNSNADEVNPQHLAEKALEIAKANKKVKATIFDKKRIEKEKMGLLLAVNRGAASDPTFIVLEYKGESKAKDHTVLIGKGITYDTGGLNLKASGMEHMKCDMGGAAVALATLDVAAKLNLPIHLTVVIPATENAISATSYKVGDVYASHSGKTVEVANTDAEGRLILADALSYAEKNLNPTRIIDFATLTGGVDIALGNEATGMMSNNDALADALSKSGAETFERVWRLPLYEEYKDNIKSDIADIKNVGTRSASTIIGGIFLQYFVTKGTPWAHFDIASTAFLNENKRYHPKYATGVGVRLMIQFLEQ